MSAEIKNLNPTAVWNHFYELTQIPRPSKHESRAIQYLKEFGENLGLVTIVDEVGNVIIRKPATPGMENRMGVILQGHIDMVPQKNSDKVHDFKTDPIEAYIDGDWVTANGTTLGADNGMGCAAAMAILEATDIIHGPLEVLITMDEETGMTGANNLQPGILQGDILINLDSEDEGELYVGCAGGEDAVATFQYQEIDIPENMLAFEISVTGLKGGHSGLDINLGRGNANKIMNRILWEGFNNHGLILCSIEGGSLRNAIPRESFAIAVIPIDNEVAFLDAFANTTSQITTELKDTEATLYISIKKQKPPLKMMNPSFLGAFFNAIYSCPNGVIRMTPGMADVPETSTNLAIVKSSDNQIKVANLMRSSVDSAKTDLGNMVRSVFELAGAEVEISGGYPGWKPNFDSNILTTMKSVYQQMTGNVPHVKVIHAGLECGILGDSYPNWDMISFGPTIRFPHSPDEKVHIESVGKFFNWLKETLKNIPTV